MSNAPSGRLQSLEDGLRLLEGRWAYFAGFGALLVALGALALGMVAAATIASVLSIGCFMVLVGLVEIVIGIGARGWGRLVLWVAAGTLYAIAGAVTIAKPAVAAQVFTLMLGAGLIATGIVRAVLSTHLPAGGPRWAGALSALVTLVFGGVVLLGWPGDSLVVLGTILGVDLIFNGVGWLSLGIGLRARARRS